MFSMANPNEITECLRVFAESTFTLNSQDMFLNLTAMVRNSIMVIERLSFDVIAFVVAAKDVL